MKPENTNHGQPLEITVCGLPATKGSVQPYTQHGHAISANPRLTQWENDVRSSALAAMAEEHMQPYNCPVAITAQIRLPKPQRTPWRMPATQTAETKGGGDLDKYARALGDGLQAVHSAKWAGLNRPGVLEDDSRIVHWNITKVYATNRMPCGAYLTITPVDEPADDWQPITESGQRRMRRSIRTTPITTSTIRRKSNI